MHGKLNGGLLINCISRVNGVDEAVNGGVDEAVNGGVDEAANESGGQSSEPGGRTKR